MDEVVFLHFSLIGIDQESDLGEGEEGNAQRQDDFSKCPLCSSQRIDAARKEIGVFVIAQQCQIGRDRHD
ncbi:MAG: hypothetical protein WC216_01150 [Gallionella sp.]